MPTRQAGALSLALLLLIQHHREQITIRLLQSQLFTTKVLPAGLHLITKFVKLLEFLVDTFLIDNVTGALRWRRTRTEPSYGLATIYPASPPPSTFPLKQLKQDRTIKLSFSGCSWQMFYHIGVAQVFTSVFPPDSNTYITAGASCGSLIAFAIVGGVDLDKMEAFCFEMLEKVHVNDNPFKPVGNMSNIVGSGLRRFIKEGEGGSAERGELDGKLFVSVSKLGKGGNLENEVVGEFGDGLVEVLMASCYIPIYYEEVGMVGGRICGDGGMTNNLLNNFGDGGGEVITISPNRFENNEVMGVSICNNRLPYPVMSSLFPGSKSDCEKMIEHGKEDAQSYIDRNFS